MDEDFETEQDAFEVQKEGEQIKVQWWKMSFVRKFAVKTWKKFTNPVSKIGPTAGESLRLNMEVMPCASDVGPASIVSSRRLSGFSIQDLKLIKEIAHKGQVNLCPTTRLPKNSGCDAEFASKTGRIDM